MVWEQDARTIVMLTQVIEGTKVRDWYIPYSGKVSQALIFASFADRLIHHNISVNAVD